MTDIVAGLGTATLDLIRALAAPSLSEVVQTLPDTVPVPVLPLAPLIRAVSDVMPQLEPVQWEPLVWRTANLADSVIQLAQAPWGFLWKVSKTLMDQNPGSTNMSVMDMRTKVILVILEHLRHCLILLPAHT